MFGVYSPKSAAKKSTGPTNAKRLRSTDGPVLSRALSYFLKTFARARACERRALCAQEEGAARIVLGLPTGKRDSLWRLNQPIWVLPENRLRGSDFDPPDGSERSEGGLR